MDVNLYHCVGVLLASTLVYYAIDVVEIWKSSKMYPLAGGASVFTPRFILNRRYVLGAFELMEDNYQRFKHRAFQFVLNHGSMIILPPTLLDELAALPRTIACPSEGLTIDLRGQYNGLDAMMRSRHHSTVLQRRLTQRLPAIVPLLEKLTTRAVEEYFPQANDWTPITTYKIFNEIIVALSSPLLVGESLAQAPEWRAFILEYSEEVMITMVTLRNFPLFMQPIVARLLPSYWGARNSLRRIRNFLTPKIQELMDADDNGTLDPKYSTKEEDSILSWLAANLKGHQRHPTTIIDAETVLTFGSTHTTLTRILNALYDMMAADASLTEELVAEIESVAIDEKGWRDMPYDRLHKLDSMIRESQRTAPMIMLGLKRTLQQPYTFQDGTYVAKGGCVAVLATAINNDPEHTPNPYTFDALRGYREKQVLGFDNVAAKDFNFSTASPEALGFGYGHSACPGRFLASLMIKMILAKVLTEYEFRFLPGQGRPPLERVNDYLVTSPTYTILVRRRAGAVCPFG